ncbi:MAG: S8 family serine peptidase [Acidimicrobiales bacterium]
MGDDTPSGAERPEPALRPAWSRESVELRLPDGVVSLDDLTPAWAWGGATGRGVRVAIIDSGIDADHPDLEGCVDVDGGIVVGLEDGEPTVSPGPHEDLFGHGTACAGIIHRLAPEARITSVRVLGEGLQGKAAVFLTGLAWAVDQGFDVINLSLGTTRRDWALPFYELCDRAYFGGSFLVTAANNIMRPSFPSLYASVTSVACNLSKDPFHFHYNPEPPTEFLAPGVDVEVSWRGGGRQVGTGNSYAAPSLAGVATLIRSKHPDLRPFQLKTALWATASNVRAAATPAGRLTGALQAAGRATVSSRATSALHAFASPAHHAAGPATPAAGDEPGL